MVRSPLDGRSLFAFTIPEVPMRFALAELPPVHRLPPHAPCLPIDGDDVDAVARLTDGSEDAALALHAANQLSLEALDAVEGRRGGSVWCGARLDDLIEALGRGPAQLDGSGAVLVAVPTVGPAQLSAAVADPDRAGEREAVASGEVRRIFRDSGPS